MTTLIVLGGTFNVLNKAHFWENNLDPHTYGISPLILANNNGCFAFGNTKHIIAYYHPANQYPASIKFLWHYRNISPFYWREKSKNAEK